MVKCNKSHSDENGRDLYSDEVHGGKTVSRIAQLRKGRSGTHSRKRNRILNPTVMREYKHDDTLNILGEELLSPGWPANENAEPQHLALKSRYLSSSVQLKEVTGV